MKIKEIKRNEKIDYDVYTVTLTPNWLEKLFGVKEKQKEYKDCGSIYKFGGGKVYVNKEGEPLGNGHPIGEAIDNWRRRW